jgi:hypothetical protein
MTGAAAQSVALEVERETRHERPIDFFGFDGKTVRPRFGDLQSAGLEIDSRICDLEEKQAPLAPIDPGANHSLAGLQAVNE